MIENTIRQIKESQAEKEKTKDLRQQLEDFKSIIVEETKPVETPSEEKIALLSSRAKKIKTDPEPVKEKIVKKEPVDKPLMPGDAVRMIDTQAAGEIIAIEGKKVQVETGSLRFFVPVDKIERISRAELKKSLRSNQVQRVKRVLDQTRFREETTRQ